MNSDFTIAVQSYREEYPNGCCLKTASAESTNMLQ